MEDYMEETQNTQEPILSPEEQQAQHEQDMIAKVDEHEGKVDDSMKTDQERMLAGKYKSVEELEKAYEHLQKKMGQGEESAEAPAQEPAPSVDEAKEVAAEAGIDYSALESEYQENGNLSEDTYKSLEERGIPKNMVDAYIAGQEAIVSTTINKMYDIVGGETQYNDMIQWAQESLSESEVAAFNSSLTSTEATEFAINGLYARYKAEQGPNFIQGQQSRSSTSGGYNSKAEMMREMADPRYGKDPAFRAEVQRRVALSSF